MAGVAVVGGGGMLGSALARAFASAGLDVTPLSHADVDVADAGAVARALNRPVDVVVNAAAWTDVDGCARDPERAMRVNGIGAGNVAAAADDLGALAVQISTNEVFEGRAGTTYAELDAPNPINPYGASKLDGELRTAAARRFLIVRTAWLFDQTRGFPARIRAAAERAASTSGELRVVANEWGNPTWVPEVAAAIVAATRLRLAGDPHAIVHLAGTPPTTRAAWARDVLGPRPSVRIVDITRAEYQRSSEVPEHAVLSTALAEQLGLGTISWRGRSTPAAVGNP